jgi:hypothetical protein
MNHLATPLFWSALQVTGLALCGLVLSALSARRAATGAFLTALTLLACCGLTALAFCPLPNWWAWHADETPSAAVRPDMPATDAHTTAPAATAPPTNAPPAPAATSFGEFRRLVAAALSPPAAPRERNWPGVVAWLFVAGVVLLSGRLVLGLWAVRRLVRRARPVTDRILLDLAAGLGAELGVGRPVAVCESDELTTAATVGWRRPVVLLPADWPAWDATVRRAVLAHELAHVRRGDFRAWFLARFSLALHFYHPLFYWLARRLQTHQEVAADAVGAGAVGVGPYRRVLARMALLQDDRPLAGPAQTFLSSPGTLLRRIHMLRVRDDVRNGRAPRGARTLGWLTLALAAVAASALRSPAEKAATGPERPAAKDPPPRKADRPPFDLTFVSPDAHGVMAFRPAAVFARPDMKEYRDRVNAELKTLFAALVKDADPPDLRVEDIEQVVASVWFRTDRHAKPGTGQTNMILGTPVLRTVRDIDWKKTLTALAPGVREVKADGTSWYFPPKGSLPMLGPNGCFCVPDARTLVVFPQPEEELPILVKTLKEKRPAPPWLADWKQVEHCLFAQCIADIRPVLAERKPEPEDAEPVMTLLRSGKSLVIGIDLDVELRCRLLARAETEKDAEKVLAATRALLKDLRERNTKPPDEPEDRSKELETIRRVADELLTRGELTRDGTRVHWRASSKVGGMAEFLNVVMGSGVLGP